MNDLELQRQTLDFSKINGNTASKDGDMPYKKIKLDSTTKTNPPVVIGGLFSSKFWIQVRQVRTYIHPFCQAHFD